MGQSYEAFNALMQQFLDELSETFPEEKNLTSFRAQFPALSSMAPTEPHKLFMAAISPHMERLAVHDDTVITDGSLSELEGLISVEKLWTAPGVTDSIRDVIWKYLDTLRMLGIGISSTPPEMMSRFESIAASISSEVEGGAPMPDMFSLVARIQQEVGDAGLQPDR